jgi:tetratricopeptide (TPR) repeat protein
VVTTFVGREHELAVLAEVRARALIGRRQLVVVTGAAGIGKTWFCEQASSAAERDGFDVLWGRCWPHGGAAALWPWPAVLPALVGPAGARLLAADGGSDEIDPERFARFAAVAELLARARRDTPTMIVIDDVHQADESALLLTRFLAGTLDRLPMVLVLVYREDTPASAEALLGELRRAATTIPLRPFGVHETTALLAAHGQPAPAQDVAGALLRVTGGSPLYLARAVEQGWVGTGPATLEHAITDTLDRLAPPERRIVAFAALLGPDGVVGDIAALAEETTAAVVEALTSAAGAGLVDQDGGFHDLVRQVAIAQLDAAALLDAHARAAALLAGRGRRERVAHHALAAAVRSDADAELAITACRAAAASLFAGYAYEQAADLLGRAVALAEHRPDLPGLAELLVERADAILASGRLSDARAAFEAATDAAERSGDPVLFARAVLGLGGMWVQEHRNAAVRQRVLARQRAALDALPPEESALRCRLTTRLAAEAVYEGGPVEQVVTALARARASGDARVLAEALSLTHNAMLGPEHAATRLPLAEELIVVASSAGDGILALFGLLWRTTDLYLLGDPDAERSLTELRQRSAAMGVATAHYVVVCMDVMRLIRAGRLDEAEAAAEQCLRLGLEIGDADALGCYGGQMVAVRWFQGRDAELADLVSDTLSSASLVVVEYGFRVSTAVVLARGGRLAEARAALRPLLDKGLLALPTSSTWLTAMVGVIESAWLLDDPVLAAEAASLVRPFADLPVMPSLAVSCFGSAARALGRAALVAGDPVAAVAHLEHAVAANVRLGHRPATMLSRAELAEALAARAAPGDRERARAELALAVAEARAMGLTHRVELWTDRLEPAVLSHGPDGWTVRCGTTRIDLPDLVGLRYLAKLLVNPGRELTAVELSDSGVVGADHHQVLDSVAVAAYRQRLRDLAEAIDDADACADTTKAERLRREREAIAGELAGAIGLGGRLRQFSSSPERARTAVRKALTRAVDAIAATDPVLGEELRAAVTTGAVCCYTPDDPARPWHVE